MHGIRIIHLSHDNWTGGFCPFSISNRHPYIIVLLFSSLLKRAFCFKFFFCLIKFTMPSFLLINIYMVYFFLPLFSNYFVCHFVSCKNPIVGLNEKYPTWKFSSLRMWCSWFNFTVTAITLDFSTALLLVFVLNHGFPLCFSSPFHPHLVWLNWFNLFLFLGANSEIIHVIFYSLRALACRVDINKSKVNLPLPLLSKQCTACISRQKPHTHLNRGKLYIKNY